MKKMRFILLLASLLLTGAQLHAQKIMDGSYGTVGYIKSDGTIQDHSYRTVGYIKGNGTVQDGSYRTIGYVKKDGTVQDASYRTIGYARDIPRTWAAFYFFFKL